MAAVFEVPHLLPSLSSAAVVPADPPHEPESQPRSLANFLGRVPESGHASMPPGMTMLERLPGTQCIAKRFSLANSGVQPAEQLTASFHAARKMRSSAAHAHTHTPCSGLKAIVSINIYVNRWKDEGVSRRIYKCTDRWLGAFGHLDSCDFSCGRRVQRTERHRERERKNQIFCRDKYPNQTHHARVRCFACIHAAAYAVCTANGQITIRHRCMVAGPR